MYCHLPRNPTHVLGVRQVNKAGPYQDDLPTSQWPLCVDVRPCSTQMLFSALTKQANQPSRRQARHENPYRPGVWPSIPLEK